MAHGVTRRQFAITAGAATLAFGSKAQAEAATSAKTLRFIAQSDLRVLDPIWTTAYITRNTATWCSTRCLHSTPNSSRIRRWGSSNRRSSLAARRWRATRVRRL